MKSIKRALTSGILGLALLALNLPVLAQPEIPPELNTDSAPLATIPAVYTGQAVNMAADAGDYFSRQRKIHRWSDQTRFVLVHISAPGHLPDWRAENVAVVKAAFAEWQRALGNRLIFVFMKDTTDADVTIHWWNTATPGAEKSACGLNMYKTWGKYIAQNDIYLSLHRSNGMTWTPDQLYSVALHEIGHMIGIKEHSDNPTDIMAEATNETLHLTARDINTMKRIYASKPHYTNPPGYHLSHFEDFRKTQKGGLWIPIIIPIPF
ncbi:MAG TPA: matrixin family metalloprotease [Coleofasciculaceae cyanobacterium]|jgi:predicted Zn-dependent protease